MPQLPPALARFFPIPRPLRALLVFLLIYIFLVGVSSLEGGIKVMGADTQASLFSNVDHPLAGLFVGILGTVLVQSSSASTSVIVGLVASGALGVDDAVPMIMGANIGTTVTNTLVSLGHVRQSNEFRRAFAAATVHDFFNVMAVALLLPVELATGWLSSIAEWISDKLVGSAGAEWESPIKKWVKEPVGWIKDALGSFGAETNVLGTLMVIIGLIVVLSSLIFITKNMKTLIAERVEQSMNAILGRGGGIVAMHRRHADHDRRPELEHHHLDPDPNGRRRSDHTQERLPGHAGRQRRHHDHGAARCIGGEPSRGTDRRPGTHRVQRVRHPAPVRDPDHAAGPDHGLAERLAEIAVHRRMIAVAYVVGSFIVVPLVGVAIFR